MNTLPFTGTLPYDPELVYAVDDTSHLLVWREPPFVLPLPVALGQPQHLPLTSQLWLIQLACSFRSPYRGRIEWGRLYAQFSADSACLYIQELFPQQQTTCATGLPSAILQQVRQLLLTSSCFERDSSFTNLFVDSRIHGWQAQLPSGNSAQERVDSLIRYLYPLQDAAGQNGLALFLQVYQDHLPKHDGRQSQARQLTDWLEGQTAVQHTHMPNITTAGLLEQTATWTFTPSQKHAVDGSWRLGLLLSKEEAVTQITVSLYVEAMVKSGSFVRWANSQDVGLTAVLST